ncbi:MAG: DNA recombination protein RmuC [Sphingorhabdus sp.]
MIIVVMAIAALLLGGAIGWFIGSRMAQAGAETTGQLRSMLDEVVAERDSVKESLARLETTLEEREKGFEQQKAALVEAKDTLSAQFGEIGQKLLGEAQEKFLQRANERFNQAGEKNEEKLKLLLHPVGEKLKAYEAQVSKVEKDRNQAYGDLKGLIGEMKQGQERVQSEAAKLVNSLRNAPKARGRWGEQQLKNVLESCGLSEHVDFVTEVSVDTSEGRMRPDAILKVPGGSSLVIDAKVSLNDYQDAFATNEDDAREIAMSRHCASMKTHIDGLSRKAYWDQFEDTPDYVIMFVPGEHFLSAALEHDPQLWDFAFEKKVLLATPTNLVAIARTVASVWRQEGLAREAKQIGALGKEMYDRIAVAAQHLKSVGSGLNSAVNNYNKFVGSFERNVVSTGRKFAELSIETGKREIEDVPEIEALPRYGSEAERALIEDEEGREAAE